MFANRRAIGKAVILIIVIVVAAGGAAVLFLGSIGTSGNTIDVSLIETDPVNQVDNLNPTNVTVMHDSTVTLAIQNGDDEARTFEISAFNVNQTISSGATGRITFTVGGPGTYMIYIPPEPPIAGYHASPAVTGYVIVT